MKICSTALGAALFLTTAATAPAAPTRTSTIAVDPDAPAVYVVNPDADSMGRLDFSGMAGVLTHEQPVGDYPRTIALTGDHLFSADQDGDTVSRRNKLDLSDLQQVSLGAGCSPWGIAPVPPAHQLLLVTCQGSNEVVFLNAALEIQGRLALPRSNPRAIAVGSDGARAYVTHYLTEEPDIDGHVSVIDVANKSLAAEFVVAGDDETCETQNSGRGVMNLLSAIAITPAPVGGELQLWVGGTQQNNITKGLFKREATFKNLPGHAMFPLAPYAAFPAGGVDRNVYRASFHDITRFGIVKLRLGDGARIGKIDVDEANNATDIEFSADASTAYVVDQTFNSYHIFNTAKGQDGDVTTLFAGPSAFGPGGKDPDQPCIPPALTSVTGEAPFRMAPQAQITTIDGYNPVDASLAVVDTGVEFDAVAYWDHGTDRMKRVPDGIATAPIGLRLSPDGSTAYVHGYLSRNVVPAATAQPLGAGGKPANLRCSNDGLTLCDNNNDCPGGTGFCNHPGGAACQVDADCGSQGPCVRGNDCIPLILGRPVSTITGRCDGGDNDGDPCLADAACPNGDCLGILGDALPPALLDGKILFNTSARDASVPNNTGLGQAAPLFNAPRRVCSNNHAVACTQHSQCSSNPDDKFCTVGVSVPGEVTSTSHDASYTTCTACHADFGGQDGRTWDFSQFGASLRNTMDLRGRPGFNPGHCSQDGNVTCFFDAACGAGNTCRSDDAMVPPNVPAPDRARWFNPMLTVHWNGDRDEVEDFEFTYRELQGSGDCDAAEDTPGCEGALVQRTPVTASDVPRRTSTCAPSCTPGVINNQCPASCFDVEADLGPPNRNLPGQATGKNVGYRLTHMADFVYSLTRFVKNPNRPNDATERGRAVFADPIVNCQSCHSGGPGTKQFFTDKRPNPAFDPGQPAQSFQNNPFIRHNVGTGNFFDAQDPHQIASQNGIFQNARLPIPAPRGNLTEYVTPVLNDVWNTRPFLHDGSAHTLLDVIRPCDSATDDCTAFGRGRNVDRQHGNSAVLTPSQLNDLTAFQNVLTAETRVGSSVAVVKPGMLTIRTATLQFPKLAGRARRTTGSFRVSGELGGRSVDPAQGVALELAVPDPASGTMRVLSRSFAMKGKGKSYAGKSKEGGSVILRLRRTADGFAFTLAGKGVDLNPLATGNTDLTVAFGIGDTTFVRNRYLEALRKKKGTYALPKKRA